MSKRLKFAPIEGAIKTVEKSGDRWISRDMALKKLEDYLTFEKRCSPYNIKNILKSIRGLMQRYDFVIPTREIAYRMESDMKSKGRSNNTIKGYLFSLEYLSHSLGGDLKLSKPKPIQSQAVYYSMDEVRRLFAACVDTREYCILSVFLCTAIRNKELRNLLLEDVDLENKRLYVRDRYHEGIKNRSERSIPLCQDCIDSIRRYLATRPNVESHALFISVDGDRFQQHGLESLIYRIKRRAGITKPGCTHILRHTALTLMATSGTPEALLQLMSGHHDRRSLAVYIHPQEADLRRYVDKYMHY